MIVIIRFDQELSAIRTCMQEIDFGKVLVSVIVGYTIIKRVVACQFSMLGNDTEEYPERLDRLQLAFGILVSVHLPVES